MKRGCRACLIGDSRHSLEDIVLFEEELLIEKATILHLLEKVMSSKLILDDEFPHEICSSCLEALVISYKFIKQFQQSQEVLSEKCNNNAIIAKQGTLPTDVAPVELIIGEQKFDLKDIVVLDETTNIEHDFSGFLRKLGTEISAQFRKTSATNLDVKQETVTLLNITKRVRNRRRNRKRVAPRVPVLEVDNVLVENEKFFVELEEQNKSSVMFSNDQYDLFNNIEAIDLNKIDIIEPKVEAKFYENCRIGKTEMFVCKICKKRFRTEKRQIQHYNFQHKNRTKEGFACDICGHVNRTRSGYHHHQLTHLDKKHLCDICNKYFRTSTVLKVHKASHENKRKFLCNICGKGFNYANALQYHLRWHNGEKKYSCPFCEKKFVMSCALKRHMRTHTGEKPYPCRLCERRFASASELREHDSIHTGERKYFCKYCGKGFVKSFNLKVHLMSHSGSHKCEICEKGFVEFEFLSRHMKTRHKDEYRLAEDVL